MGEGDNEDDEEGDQDIEPAMGICENLPESVQKYSFLKDATPAAFVRETFKNYPIELINATHCSTKYTSMVCERPPFDPTNQTPADLWNAHVSMQMMGLPRPIRVGDKVAIRPFLAGGRIHNESRGPVDVFAAVANDLTTIDSGQPPNVPNATVTCASSTRAVRVKGMQCAFCKVPSTCLMGFGCFSFFTVECYYEPGTRAKRAALRMVRKMRRMARRMMRPKVGKGRKGGKRRLSSSRYRVR